MFRANQLSMGRPRRHSIVFKGSGRIQPLILKEEGSRLQTRVRGDVVRFLKDRLAFPDRDAILQLRERKEFVKTPDATKTLGDPSLTPKLLEIVEGLRNGELIPFVIDVQKTSAVGTRMMDLQKVESMSAIRVNATLKCRHDIILGLSH